MALLNYFKEKGHLVKADSMTIFAAARDPRTPFYAKAAAFIVLAYLFSPIDIVPDFIPVLGWIDDVVVAWLGLALIEKLIPSEVLADARIEGTNLALKAAKGKRLFTCIVALLALFAITLFICAVLLIVFLFKKLVSNT